MPPGYYPPFARRAKGEVFVLLYVFVLFFCFVRSTISQQPVGRFTPKFACGRSLGQDMKSPLLGVGGPRRVEKGANEIFVTIIHSLRHKRTAHKNKQNI